MMKTVPMGTAYTAIFLALSFGSETSGVLIGPPSYSL